MFRTKKSKLGPDTTIVKRNAKRKKTLTEEWIGFNPNGMKFAQIIKKSVDSTKDLPVITGNLAYFPGVWDVIMRSIGGG